MTVPTVETTDSGAYVVTCPTCGALHHTIYRSVAERIATHHRCPYYAPAKRGA